jgi:hypothetical protein
MKVPTTVLTIWRMFKYLRLIFVRNRSIGRSFKFLLKVSRVAFTIDSSTSTPTLRINLNEHPIAFNEEYLKYTYFGIVRPLK